MLAVIFSFIYLDQIFIPSGMIEALALIGSAILTASIISFFLILNHNQKTVLVRSVLFFKQVGLFTTVLLSILIQIFILITYVILAWQFLPYADPIKLAGAFSFVLVATAIPIGTGGWGVREVTAGSAFALFGFPIEVGIFSALSYGVIHIIILSLSALFLTKYNLQSNKLTIGKKNYEKFDFWAVGFFFIFLLLPFQMKIPIYYETNNFISSILKVTINFSDLVALIVSINFLLYLYFKSKLAKIWIYKFTWIALGSFFLMISIGWLVGYIKFGSNAWATISRLVGMISILSFFLTGAAVRQCVSKEWQAKLGLILGITIVICCFFQFFFIARDEILQMDKFGYVFFKWEHPLLTGFVGDRNAFSLLSLLAFFFIYQSIIKKHFCNTNPLIILAILGFLASFTIYTGSRTGFGGLFILILWMSITNRLFALKIIAFVSAFYLLLFLFDFYSDSQSLTWSHHQYTFFTNASNPRWLTWQTGWSLFTKSYLFGSGLGSSIEQIGMVIHNLYLWILGEMGLVGFALSLPLAWVLVKACFYPYKTKFPDRHNTLFFCLIVSLFTITHDVAYQRSLWLMLGYLLVVDYSDSEKV